MSQDGSTRDCWARSSEIDAPSQQLTVLLDRPRPRLSGTDSSPIIPAVPRTHWSSPAVLAAVALIGLATLTPGSGQGGWGLGFPDPADLLVNLGLYVPLGMAMRRRPGARRADRRADHPSLRSGQACRPLRAVVVAAFLISLSIELAQFSFIPGRDASPWDLAANVAGALLGASLSAHLVTLPLIPAWLASGWLLTPVPPPTPVWWGQWAHQFGSPAPFSGTIRAVALNGKAAPDQSLGELVTAQMKARYQAPAAVLTIDLLPPVGPSPSRVQVAGIADGAGGEVMGFWQLGWDLELRWHAQGTRWGLRHPAIRAPGLLEGLPPTEKTIFASFEPGHAFIGILDNRTFAMRLGPWEGWRLWWPVTTPRPALGYLLGAGWTIVCLGVPLMLWVPSLLGTRRKPRCF